MAETATINGTDLAYIENGRGQPVVFVHGGVGDYREWDLQMPAFTASFRAIALSCRGAWPNHKLEPGEEITLDTFVEDLASFITRLDLAPVHLVGHSSPGGFGGLLLAHRYPELVRSLVLLEPPAFPLETARRPATVAGLGSVSFVAGDAQTYEFGGSVYDVVVSRFALMLFADPVAAFTNLVHALRQGGRLGFVCWQDAGVKEWMLVPSMAA